MAASVISPLTGLGCFVVLPLTGGAQIELNPFSHDPAFTYPDCGDVNHGFIIKPTRRWALEWSLWQSGDRYLRLLLKPFDPCYELRFFDPAPAVQQAS